VLRDGARWTIEAEWADGTIEIVETFADYFEALRWLSTQASAWIEQRIVVKDAG
jgi:hypothetical protein